MKTRSYSADGMRPGIGRITTGSEISSAAAAIATAVAGRGEGSRKPPMTAAIGSNNSR